MSAPRIERPSEVDRFLEATGAFLLAREAQNCVMLGLCSQMRTGAMSIQSFTPYFAVARRDGDVVGAALIAGYLALLSSPMDEAALPLLVADIAAAAPDLPGVVAEVATARRFAELWTAETGRSHRLNMSERIFRLTRVIPPRPVEGRMRIVNADDRDMLARWLQAFNMEALAQTVDLAAMEQFADRWIARAGRSMYFWEVDGTPVAMAGIQGDTPSGIRISGVYTPPELRGRGYASALTAAVTQAQLDAGKRYCFLFTDLANPTSNKIYTAIGYEPVADAADHRFDLPA